MAILSFFPYGQKGITKEQLRERNLLAQATYEAKKKAREETNVALDASISKLCDLLC
jgi:hypothetical protein